MRTSTELQEKIDHLVWYKCEVCSQFQLISMGVRKHAVLAAFYRTIDNEINMLRWALGQVDQTWSDDLSNSIDIEHHVDCLPKTEFPHWPYKRHAHEYWGHELLPRVCPYFPGPDSPADDPKIFSKKP